MATVDLPDVGLNRSTLAALAETDPRENSPITGAWRRASAELTDTESDLLPDSFAAILPALAGDPDRFQLALNVLTQFDLYETVPVLVDLLHRSGDMTVATTAAVLASNPGCSQSVASELIDLIGQLASDRLRSALLPRLLPAFEPRNPTEWNALTQAWPGRTRRTEGGSRLIAVDLSLAPARQVGTLLGVLVDAGADIRRIAPRFARQPDVGWISADMPIFSWDPEAVGRLRSIWPQIRPEMICLVPASVEWPADRFLIEANARLHTTAPLRLRPHAIGVDLPNPFLKDVYQAGAFDIRDVAFLTGYSAGSIRDLARDELPPTYAREREPYWSFAQVVAARTLNYWRLQSGRRVPRSILSSLTEFAGADRPTRIGLDGSGRVLIAHNGSYVDWKTGQVMQPPELLLDRVFRPFEIGGGRVPALEDPSVHTRVNPVLQGGTPCIKGKRVPARSLALAIQRQPIADSIYSTIATAYPELSEAEVLDGVNVGQQLLAAGR